MRGTWMGLREKLRQEGQSWRSTDMAVLVTGLNSEITAWTRYTKVGSRWCSIVVWGPELKSTDALSYPSYRGSLTWTSCVERVTALLEVSDNNWIRVTRSSVKASSSRGSRLHHDATLRCEHCEVVVLDELFIDSGQIGVISGSGHCARSMHRIHSPDTAEKPKVLVRKGDQIELMEGNQ